MYCPVGGEVWNRREGRRVQPSKEEHNYDKTWLKPRWRKSQLPVDLDPHCNTSASKPYTYQCPDSSGLPAAKFLPSCPTLHHPMGCSPPGSSVHGSFQSRILEWVTIVSSRKSSWPRVIKPVSPPSPLLAGRFFTTESLEKPLIYVSYITKNALAYESGKEKIYDIFTSVFCLYPGCL